jgi:predicted CXXCH cytochrome family protein
MTHVVQIGLHLPLPFFSAFPSLLPLLPGPRKRPASIVTRRSPQSVSSMPRLRSMPAWNMAALPVIRIPMRRKKPSFPNTHASDAPRLLTRQIRVVCQNCHPDKTNGKHILGGYGFGDNHPIMGHLDPSRKGQELGCTSCHNPHSSEKKVLLINDGPDSPANLCLQCHTKITVRP